MNTLTFDQLPNEVSRQNERLERIENLLKELKEQNQPETPDELLTVEQAAEFLSLATPTIYGLVQRGELPVMKRSKRLYFSKHELLAYLKKGRKKSIEEIEAEADQYLK
ncbi:MAG: helix-turn-helix domain-containing protein [Bacteroidales bacterium]